MELNTDLVKQLVSLLGNMPLDETNVVDWKFVGGILTVKLEDNDGMVCVYDVQLDWMGYARSMDNGDFSVVKP